VIAACRMESRLHFDIAAQPDLTTCGPTCLHAVYQYFGDNVPLAQLAAETPRLEQGGTLAVLLGCHALRRGYRATIYTYNLHLFDPTWFRPGASSLAERIEAQMQAKDDPKLQAASRGYLDYLRLGGSVRMQDMTGNLLRRYLKKSVPVLTGLSATYLYNEPREAGVPSAPDDVCGVPQGHFVVLCGYDPHERTVLVADPLQPNPLSRNEPKYVVDLDRLICAIMLGIVTYDANLLIIQPREPRDAARPPGGVA
jgi:hypothetical protein